MHGIAERALIDHAVGIAREALAEDFAVLPLALIGAAIGEGDHADAVGFAGDELALVDRAVGELRAALAADFALEPLAGIFIAIGQPIGAAAMLAAVQERALIDAAIVVLLGLDGLRRCGRRERGQNCRDAECLSHGTPSGLGGSLRHRPPRGNG